MPAKPRVKIELVGDQLTLHWSARAWGIAAFMLLWFTGWSFGCGFLLHKLITDFEWEMALFAIPFFVAWIGVADFLTYLLLGRHQLSLGRESLKHSSWALIPLGTREIPLDEVLTASVDEEISHEQNDVPVWQNFLRIETLGNPIKFAKGIKKEEGEWLAETVNLCLEQMAPHRAALQVAESVRDRHSEAADEADTLLNEPYETEEDDELSLESVVFVPTNERWHPPTDTHWTAAVEGRSVVFTNRGRWTFSAMAASLFICLFWNGIVTVFLVQLFKKFELFLALFLIPFEIIGLCLIGACFAAFTAPAWGNLYRFGTGRLERKWWGPMIGRTKRTEIKLLDRIELSYTPKANNQSPNLLSPTPTGTGEYGLALIDTDNVTQLEIKNLNKGEALWMADKLMYELPDMFERRR